jgi:hypothetical protein
MAKPRIPTSPSPTRPLPGSGFGVNITMRTILNIFAWSVVGLFLFGTGYFVVASLVCIFGGVESNGLRYSVFAITMGCLAVCACWALKFVATNGTNNTNG